MELVLISFQKIGGAFDQPIIAISHARPVGDQHRLLHSQATKPLGFHLISRVTLSIRRSPFPTFHHLKRLDRTMSFDTLLNVLKALNNKEATPQDVVIQKKILQSTLIRIGNQLKLSLQHPFRQPTSKSNVVPVASANSTTTRDVASPTRRRKRDKSLNPHSAIVESENCTDASATPRRGERSKLRRTNRRFSDHDGEVPSVHCICGSAAVVSAGSISNWVIVIPRRAVAIPNSTSNFPSPVLRIKYISPTFRNTKKKIASIW